jgi:hypothetical protein
MNRQYISEAFEQLDQMSKSKKRLTEADDKLTIKNSKGELITLKVARDIMNYTFPEYTAWCQELENFSEEEWEQYRQEKIRQGFSVASDRDDLIQRIQDMLSGWKEMEQKFLDQAEIKYGEKFTSLDEIPEGHGRGRTRAFDGTINSFRQLNKIHTDNVTSFILGKPLVYDSVDSLEDNWSESIDGVKDEDEAFSLFKIRGNNAYLPKGTMLEYAGHDSYYDWFTVNGTGIKLGFLSDYSMYD